MLLQSCTCNLSSTFRLWHNSLYIRTIYKWRQSKDLSERAWEFDCDIWPDDEIKIWHEKIVILHVFDWNATLPSKVIDMFFLCGHTHCNLTNPFGVLSYHVTTSLNCSSLRALNNSLADATKASSKALASLVLFHP